MRSTKLSRSTKAPFIGESPAPSTSLKVTGVMPPGSGEVEGTMALAVRDTLKTPTVLSIMRTDANFCRPKSIFRLVIEGSILTTQRNECIQRMQGDWILFVDDDMVWEPDAVERLWKTMKTFDLDVVGGLCFRRSHPYQPTLYMRETPTEGLYHSLEVWDEDEVVEVDATGTAFLMVTVRAIERLIGGPMPSYEERTKELMPPAIFRWVGVKGEDVQFCEDLKAAGNRIFVDTGVKIRHIADVEISEHEFFQAVAERGPEAQAHMEKLNDKYGLRTLTLEEAKERLYGAE